MFKLRSGVVFAVLSCASLGASAFQIVLSANSIVGSSGALSPSFPATRVVDQQTGPVSDTFATTYWLNPDGTGSLPVYITIDLGSALRIDSFDLFNTHNAFYNDRGTGSFQILGSNTVMDTGNGNLRVNGGTVLISSALTTSTGVPLAQSFTSSSSAAFRYVSFEPLSALSPLGRTPSATSYGLNEIRIFASAVPELPQYAMLLCGLAVAALRWSRGRA